MNGLLNIYKPPGFTPYQCVKVIKERCALDIKIGYAGRLDPMASGVLLLMLGQTCKQRDHYQNFSKSYTFDVLLGVSTASLDPLSTEIEISQPEIELDQINLKDIAGEILRLESISYPKYSSKAVDGIPLHTLSRSGVEIEELPKKDINVTDFKILSVENVSLGESIQPLLSYIPNIEGHFNQKESVELWKDTIKSNEGSSFTKLHCEISSSTGTYVRSVAQEIGRLLGTDAIALNIHRTRVGSFKNTGSQKVW